MAVLTVVVGILFVITGGVKVIGLRQSLAIRDHFSISPALWRIVGILEAAGGVGTLVGLAWTPLGVAALIGLALLIVGAIVSRVRVGDSLLWKGIDVLTLALVLLTLLVTL